MGFKVDPTADLFPEGDVLLEVSRCEVKRSKKGDAMFSVTLFDIETNRKLFENWMMEGKGQGMTVPKLKALGCDLSKEIEPYDLVGLRALATIKHKHSDFHDGIIAVIVKMRPASTKPDEPRTVHEVTKPEDAPF